MSQEATTVLVEVILLLYTLGLIIWLIVPLVKDLVKLARWLKARGSKNERAKRKRKLEV
jgi:antibiotic biosynthesis monooxygenase (ABM) superfamily enzyme